MREWRKSHPEYREYQKNYCKKWNEINKEQAIQKKREYRINNKDKIQKMNKEYYEKIKKQNPEYFIEARKRSAIKRRSYAKKYNKENTQKIILRNKERRHNDPCYRLSTNMTSHIYKALRSRKNGRKWEDLVGYTLNDLKLYLESQFKEGMTWDNYGKWHVDHIIPKVLFKYDTYDDKAFKECWALSNLQPLWKLENQLKGAHLF